MFLDPIKAGRNVVALNCAFYQAMCPWLFYALPQELVFEPAQDILEAKDAGDVEKIVQLAESYMSSDQYENAQAAVDVILKHGRPEHGMRQRIELFLVDADPHSHCRSGTTPEWREEMAERLWAVHYAINGIKPVIKDILDHDI